MSTSRGGYGRLLFAGAVVLSLCFGGAARADEEQKKGKGKAKDEKPNAVQIDLSKLPPDLVKQLLKYAGEDKKPGKEAKGPPTGKGPQADKKPGVARELPPGLRNKPANHPGRLAFLAKHGGKAPKKVEEPKKKKKPGKGDDEDSD